MQGYSNRGRLFKWGRRREAIDEASLIDQILKGDHAKFREIIDRYGRHVYQVTYSVLHQAQDAEDAAQEAFIQVFKSLPQYRSEGFKTWITRIALHKAIDLKRKLNRREAEVVGREDEVVQMADHQADIIHQLLKKERKETLLHKISSLPAQHRDIIVDFYLKEKNYEQIAEESQIAIKTVESRLYRARQWIRAHWKEGSWRE
ncbi:RNA polymerase sigma factor [Paenibacillus urinalis]|uniref:RNA polymerase sigma factor n=1 Tax=Paenibacillus urinalis TaxID=521520 RepID=A0ABY7XJF4_9BACL|nr:MULTISPECIES: RNA polymerase sigma factor [Paenibacillus]WDI00088.1 RNA polymerase sigma factor [Paenibacillus urinalis]WDI04916.1 RNA polymerase sigma factor [Paenibacillus urinalis]